MFREAIKNNNIIILGDFNYNLPLETNEIYRHGFIDLWYELKPSEEKDYTYDPLENPMMLIYEPFDDRRLRLDRIALKN